MEKFRVIVAGTRTFSDYGKLSRALDRLLASKQGVEIISGGAPGADALGERYAKERGLPLSVMRADWRKHGRAAGPIRNSAMASQADALVAFWDGRSRGTMNMIEEAKKRHLQVRVIKMP